MKVIVNADDLGMSLAVNDAIFRAFDEGLLVSTTALVHGPAFGDAVRRTRNRPGLHIGVHLDTTEFHLAPDRLQAWREQVRIAREAGIAYDIRRIDEISRKARMISGSMLPIDKRATSGLSGSSPGRMMEKSHAT